MSHENGVLAALLAAARNAGHPVVSGTKPPKEEIADYIQRRPETFSLYYMHDVPDTRIPEGMHTIFKSNAPAEQRTDVIHCMSETRHAIMRIKNRIKKSIEKGNFSRVYYEQICHEQIYPQIIECAEKYSSMIRKGHINLWTVEIQAFADIYRLHVVVIDGSKSVVFVPDGKEPRVQHELPRRRSNSDLYKARVIFITYDRQNNKFTNS